MTLGALGSNIATELFGPGPIYPPSRRRRTLSSRWKQAAATSRKL